MAERGPISAYKTKFFGAEGAEKLEKLAKVTHFWRRRRRNFLKTGVILQKNSPIFVKIEDFIVRKCILIRVARIRIRVRYN